MVEVRRVIPLARAGASKRLEKGVTVENLQGKVAIVTGSNTGIGKETARGLVRLGATVVLAVRDAKKGEAARADIARTEASPDARVRVMPLDLADTASIRAFAAAFKREYKRLDILVNNAGLSPAKRSNTKDGFETTFGVNHLGTFLLTRELLDVLKSSAPARVVVLSSALHYRGKMVWDDLQFTRRKYGTLAAYNQSKLANVLFTGALARRLGGTGVTVNAVHPGVVQTELARDMPRVIVKIMHLFMLPPDKGARCSLDVATSPELAGVSGAYFEKSKVKKPSARALDEADQERLWKLSEELLGLAQAAKRAA
jgi:NAD(P)-dependent dehydrogenase (short-subunit alcohol dehydrogenase family)